MFVLVTNFQCDNISVTRRTSQNYNQAKVFSVKFKRVLNELYSAKRIYKVVGYE